MFRLLVLMLRLISVFVFLPVADPARRLPGGDHGSPPHRRPAGAPLHPAPAVQELTVCRVQQRAEDPEGGRAQRFRSEDTKLFFIFIFSLLTL